MGKRMPEAAKNYSITKLEMCGLAINLARFAHLLKRVDFYLNWVQISLKTENILC